MSPPITAPDGAEVEAFARVVDRRIGVQLAGKEYLVESRLHPIALAEEFASVGELLAAVRRGDQRLEDLAVEAMTTNETSFFRDRHPFDSLVTTVLPELAERSGGRLSVWNGACASGQESYSLAMSILDHLPHLAVDGRTTILSTDVSPRMVERTRLGSYSRFEVGRGLSNDLAARHFVSDGRTWTASPELRAMITTRELNLIGPWHGLPRCDLVLLRNVLIYFAPAVRSDVLRRIRTEVLRPGGYLVLGASETVSGLDDGFETRHVGQSVFHVVPGAA